MFRFRRASVLWHDRPLLTWNPVPTFTFPRDSFSRNNFPPWHHPIVNVITVISAASRKCQSLMLAFSLVRSPEYWPLIGWRYPICVVAAWWPGCDVWCLSGDVMCDIVTTPGIVTWPLTAGGERWERGGQWSRFLFGWVSLLLIASSLKLITWKRTNSDLSRLAGY